MVIPPWGCAEMPAPCLFLLQFMAKDRAIIYIDSSNLYLRAKGVCGTGKVKLREFSDFLAGPNRIVHKIKYFCVAPPEPNRSDYNVESQSGLQRYSESAQKYVAQKRWLRSLARWNQFELIYGKLIRNRGGRIGYSEKGVDVALAIHMVADVINPQHQVSIIVTGDSDLVSAVYVVKGARLRVEGAAFQPCFDISQACDSFTFLDSQNMAPFLI